MFRRPLFLLLPVLLGLAAVGGCGQSGPKTYPVSGQVTWDGQPILEGHVQFFPKDAALAPSAGRIENGRFQFRSTAGAKRVEILADRDVGKPDPVMNVVRREQFLPDRYNDESILTVEVTADGSNDFTFSLTSK